MVGRSGGGTNKVLTPGRLCMNVQMDYIKPIKDVCGLLRVQWYN